MISQYISISDNQFESGVPQLDCFLTISTSGWTLSIENLLCILGISLVSTPSFTPILAFLDSTSTETTLSLFSDVLIA